MFLVAPSSMDVQSWSYDVNGRLGRHLSPRQQAQAYLRLLEADLPHLATDYPPVVFGTLPAGPCIGLQGYAPRFPTSSTYRESGWLSPEGLWLPCESYRHEELADAVSPQGSIGLEEAGWLRISMGRQLLKPGKELTEAQAGWLLQE